MDDLQKLHGRFTAYMNDKAAYLRATRGGQTRSSLEHSGVVYLDLPAFHVFWERVSRAPTLHARWCRRLDSGFDAERARITQEMSDLCAECSESSDSKAAA